MHDNSPSHRIFAFLIVSLFSVTLQAQVNAVEYGKNRIQHKKFIWKFYQSPNFNSYFNQNGLELGKFAAQVAEDELKSVETAVEYALQRRINIVIYNSYNDMKSSNIGLGTEWMNAGGTTKFVNNKVVVYFDGNHAHLRRQIREGIARVLVDNQLFGDDIGEFASNQALLDLPTWLTDGFVSYIGEDWSTEWDDDLKSAMLSGRYNNFYQFAFEKPLLAGRSFWYYISEKYKKENVAYFLYLARIYKSLNSASQRIAKKKFKEVLADFMAYEQDKYYKDIRQRRNVPKGSIAVSEEILKKDFFRFNANPNPRSNSYGVVEYHKGIYSVKLNENYETVATLYSSGVRNNQATVNPTYPLMAWDGKGTRLAVIYWEKGKIKMFVYDAIAKFKRNKQEIEGLDQIQDVQFMLDQNTLLFSAVKNGHSDIYVYKIEANKLQQLTNDVYDDIDASFVSFPNKTGIIFASNRPSPGAVNSDTALPSKNRFNIFLLDYLTGQQISQLSNVKFGNARYPMQYNTNHFTYVSDESGVGNRWAGFFSTHREGLDTLFYVGDEILRNPEDKELDSTLVAWQRSEPDSISYFQVTKDSTYTFPMTNYQSSLLETRIAGDRGQVSEVTRQGDYKFLYKLRVDSLALRRRNINPRPTDYMKKLMTERRASEGRATAFEQPVDTSAAQKDFFQNEFSNEKDSGRTSSTPSGKPAVEPVLQRSKLYNYRFKFNNEYVVSGVSNNILINRYQPYGGGQGPIQLGNGSNLNFTFRASISDLMEDIKFVGGFRLGTNLRDNDYLFGFQNFRKRFDWGLTYYRTSDHNINLEDAAGNQFGSQLNTSLYQFNGSYPLNEVKSLRATVAYRRDNFIIKPIVNGNPNAVALGLPDITSKYVLSRLEYVHDNTLNPTQNIWIGLRWKIYMDVNMPIDDETTPGGKYTYNFGFDARNYVQIYRNFIWATRAAADFSWGNRKLIYYLGGVDGWINPKFNSLNQPLDQNYAFQTLAVNMRGFQQNIANGNNAFVFNSELRLPVFSTLINKPINNAFLRNFQVTQFIDLGTAWNGQYNKISRPSQVFSSPDPTNPITFRKKAGGIGPFAGGYGFGARSTLLGYFLKVDASWEMNGIFRDKPYWYFALGFDF
jgi:Tol biopolymer transport system component